MQISQYVYFALRSETRTAAAITERLGVEPNRVSVRASRHPERDVPRSHSWGIECKAPGMTVDQQVATVLSRLLPIARKIADLRKDFPDVDAVLQIVRTFDDPDGAEEDLTPSELGYEKLAGQHQLLGWHLDHDVLNFLHLTGAELDVDEYG